MLKKMRIRITQWMFIDEVRKTTINTNERKHSRHSSEKKKWIEIKKRMKWKKKTKVQIKNIYLLIREAKSKKKILFF